MQKNVVFCDIFGLIPESPTLAFGVLQMQKEVSDVVGVLPAIISDVVNQSRVSSHLISELREAAVALLSIFGRETKKKPPVLVHKRFLGVSRQLCLRSSQL